MQRPGSGCTSTGATCLQSRTALIRFTQTFTDPSKTCSNAIGLGVSQKVTKRTKPEFGVNADSWFPSFASVNLFWFAVVAASLRRGALGGTHSRHGDSRLPGASACRAAPWLQHQVTRNGKGVRPGANAFPISFGARRGEHRYTLQLYGLFVTTCGAGLLTSSWALTFWICAACSLSCAVRVSICFCCCAPCFCCCATVACNFSTLSFSMAWRWPGDADWLKPPGWSGFRQSTPSRPSILTVT